MGDEPKKETSDDIATIREACKWLAESSWMIRSDEKGWVYGLVDSLTAALAQAEQRLAAYDAEYSLDESAAVNELGARLAQAHEAIRDLTALIVTNRAFLDDDELRVSAERAHALAGEGDTSDA